MGEGGKGWKWDEALRRSKILNNDVSFLLLLLLPRSVFEESKTFFLKSDSCHDRLWRISTFIRLWHEVNTLQINLRQTSSHIKLRFSLSPVELKRRRRAAIRLKAEPTAGCVSSDRTLGAAESHLQLSKTEFSRDETNQGEIYASVETLKTRLGFQSCWETTNILPQTRDVKTDPRTAK